MIDIHCHIIPGFDDGADTLYEAVEMAGVLAEEGVTIVFATPHISFAEEMEMARRIEPAVEALQNEIDERNIPLSILPGAEIYPSDDVLLALDNGMPISLGTDGRYLLLDTPLGAMPTDLERLVLDLLSRGKTPILAHPERSRAVQEDPGILWPMVNHGLLLQINASSLLGRHGDAALKTALAFLEHRWAQFIASDAHSAYGRRPMLREAYGKVVELVGVEKAEDLFVTNGGRVQKGETVPTDPMPAVPTLKRSWIRRIIRSRKV